MGETNIKHDHEIVEELIDEDIIGLESGDIIDRIEAVEKYNKVKNRHGKTFYQKLIFALTNIRIDEKTASDDWKSILLHMRAMNQKLGRNVGIRVATLDFYTNFKKQIVSPKIIDMNEYTTTVRQSITDPLTRCYNRRYFDYLIKHHFVVAQETGKPIVFCMADIDDFKLFNDRHGHIAGDLALIEISRILNAVTRKTDIVARYGGEEFGIIMPGVRKKDAEKVCSRLRKAVAAYRFPGGTGLTGKKMTISVGIAGSEDGPATHMDLIQKADTALYQCKNGGKNCVRLFQPVLVSQ
ncbi:MAG: hypothetical protein A2268_04390 [Candidatus Raymondbacteria bacterium RifOxyA12_full_50_37]|uniref:GGDEF domain-containing protein n=1 Tax=Candidatus Raymondbacteria bacterium RIFOXYD12_FULL_49_13 TaxID=1817890 RepID=A0A1F7FAZ2_UNCRA|nr:MAG: hypothetical protein A2268_04390 [Candidatus Raymondbacteria bacterium RifOxyA12_full_50_37]OGJ87707.1 MAG: hypothetical protein A2350_13635 [Candidatus Raymondbacteria bacterium RifOxyB12_full_50_8]OGJ92538.1 MAG: hypothetical protein A2248_05560 [Candidatus Raymondbacteria bacterium RIFOXYA2_FULL_49_16]OGJ97892.1 MAG: hypothetical protein A2453_02585 [Candidatus Raymondbacteria bacterium RIFOXYC2_FULL_50_21]OGK03829.1 MAG: hypothetical protein A2519_02230 [Candidatus Raymondbacteria b